MERLEKRSTNRSGGAFLVNVFLLSLSMFFLAVCLTTTVDACNEAVCASIVSKCMITQSCKCDLKNCSCCKECFNCLNHLYSECCSCVENNVQEVDPMKDVVTLNCTVAYMSQCMSWNKCKGSCQSMGAASYRWFHDGCCQCIGDRCINYGINESR
ncbi:unnamed protein product [Nesidiocoris tenuis]|uniref:Protein twisted gastrulation n=1 Tax=Nesidiocoris tenuis TaxID=355587 RepID=A0A6H5GUQ8_9HEMI|nr:unnamed protein product [Nesidiocoris tenuis]